MARRYAIERHPNKDYVSIHVDVTVPEISMFQANKTSPEGASMKDEILAINGVQEVYTRGQCVALRRGGAFTVDEIVRPVLECLKRLLNVDEWVEVELYP